MKAPKFDKVDRMIMRSETSIGSTLRMYFKILKVAKKLNIIDIKKVEEIKIESLEPIKLYLNLRYTAR